MKKYLFLLISLLLSIYAFSQNFKKITLPDARAVIPTDIIYYNQNGATYKLIVYNYAQSNSTIEAFGVLKMDANDNVLFHKEFIDINSEKSFAVRIKSPLGSNKFFILYNARNNSQPNKSDPKILEINPNNGAVISLNSLGNFSPYPIQIATDFQVYSQLNNILFKILAFGLDLGAIPINNTRGSIYLFNGQLSNLSKVEYKDPSNPNRFFYPTRIDFVENVSGFVEDYGINNSRKGLILHIPGGGTTTLTSLQLNTTSLEAFSTFDVDGEVYAVGQNPPNNNNPKQGGEIFVTVSPMYSGPGIHSGIQSNSSLVFPNFRTYYNNKVKIFGSASYNSITGYLPMFLPPNMGSAGLIIMASKYGSTSSISEELLHLELQALSGNILSNYAYTLRHDVANRKVILPQGNGSASSYTLAQKSFGANIFSNEIYMWDGIKQNCISQTTFTSNPSSLIVRDEPFTQQTQTVTPQLQNIFQSDLSPVSSLELCLDLGGNEIEPPFSLPPPLFNNINVNSGGGRGDLPQGNMVSTELGNFEKISLRGGQLNFLLKINKRIKELSIFDIEGKLLQKNLNVISNQIQLNNVVKKGIVLIKIYFTDGTSETKKILIY